MTSRTFSTLNPNAIGPLLALDLGNLVVKTNADGLNRDRKVLGTVPRGVGSAFFEFYAYSDSQPAAGMGQSVVVGVAKPHSALDAAVGDDADSFGLVLGTGDIGNGSAGPSVNAQSERVCIGVYLNVDPATPTLTLNTNGSFLAEIALPAGQFWVPAITVSGGTGAGDFKAFANFGQRGFDHPVIVLSDGTNVRSDGWYIQNTEGIPTIYLAIVDEGFVTSKTDTPASKVHRPRIRNPETFSIKRTAVFWPQGDTSVQQAAYGSLEIDNYDGEYSFLTRADLRGATVVLYIPKAYAFAPAHTLDSIEPIATCVLDNVTADDSKVIVLTLRDTLSRLDRPLPCRYNPPFVDSNAANRMVPMTFGACRNVAPQLIDQTGAGTGRPIYRLSDAQITNVAAVRDMGAPLDPNATPPQDVPALNGSGIQLQVPPAGKLACDISSEGTQVVIPGAADVLAGTGLLAAWPVALSPPTGWSYGTMTGSITRQAFPHVYTARLATKSAAGQSMYVTAPVLEGGKAYRITFHLGNWSGSLSEYATGFMLSTTDSPSPINSITGQLLTAPQFGYESYTFVYRVPPGATRNIYATLVGDPIYPPVFIVFWGLAVEELGEYDELPLVGTNLENYFTEILKNRAGEDPGIWSAADLQAIDAATGYSFGVHFDEQPNILDALQLPVNGVCGNLSTDADGDIRIARLIDPHGVTPIATFDDTDLDYILSISSDDAKALTTLMGGRRNWSPYSASDFVTDTLIVPQDVKERFMRQSQYQRTAAVLPAGHYSSAIGAPVFDSVLDNVGLDGQADDVQTEIDRVNAFYAPTVYDDDQIGNGKRNFYKIKAHFDNPDAIGTTTKCAVRDILIGSVISASFAGNGATPELDDKSLLVVGTELFPFAGVIVIEGEG